MSVNLKRKKIEKEFMPAVETPREPSIENSILPRTVHPSAKLAHESERPNVEHALERGD
jgi:hypothetical protein